LREQETVFDISGAIPEDNAHRDNAAIAQVASLLPATAAEALIAAEFVGASAYALDCLRQAREFRGDPVFFLKCNAQAASSAPSTRQPPTDLRDSWHKPCRVRQTLHLLNGHQARAEWLHPTTSHCNLSGSDWPSNGQHRGGSHAAS
jgi:hypothetical protein